jgi:hypothetical protein
VGVKYSDWVYRITYTESETFGIKYTWIDIFGMKDKRISGAGIKNMFSSVNNFLNVVTGLYVPSVEGHEPKLILYS